MNRLLNAQTKTLVVVVICLTVLAGILTAALILLNPDSQDLDTTPEYTNQIVDKDLILDTLQESISASNTETAFQPTELIISFANENDKQEFLKTEGAKNLTEQQKIFQTTYLFNLNTELTAADFGIFLKELNENPLVRYAEPNYIAEYNADKAYYNTEWQLGFNYPDSFHTCCAISAAFTSDPVELITIGRIDQTTNVYNDRPFDGITFVGVHYTGNITDYIEDEIERLIQIDAIKGNGDLTEIPYSQITLDNGMTAYRIDNNVPGGNYRTYIQHPTLADTIIVTSHVTEFAELAQIFSSLYMGNRITPVSSDTLVAEQWAISNDGTFENLSAIEDWDSNIDLGWELAGSKEVVVALIDSGFDSLHPDLSNKLWTNEDEIPDNQIDDDSNGYVDDYYGIDGDPLQYVGGNHGTWVGSIIVADTNNAEGIAGICPACKIMYLAGIGDGPAETEAERQAKAAGVAERIAYAVDNGADVVNMSFGMYWYSQVVKDVAAYAYSNDAILVAAAGNTSADTDEVKTYPAAYPEVISVAGQRPDGQRSLPSAYGFDVDVSAPAGYVWVARPHNEINNYARADYIYQDVGPVDPNNDGGGTSFAAPHVSGIVGLLLSKYPDLTSDEVFRIVTKLGVKEYADYGLDLDYYLGEGMIDAEAVLKAARSLNDVTADIQTPLDGANRGQAFDITGTATDPVFLDYKIYMGPGYYPTESEYELVYTGSSRVVNGVLANIPQDPNKVGIYTIKLVVTDDSGDVATDTVRVNLNNNQQ